MTFGEKLQTLRRGAGMSQDALAEKLEVSRQAVSKWERDETMPETDKLVRIARLFGVSLDGLLLDKQEEPRDQQPRYQPRTEPVEVRLERFLRRHGYKFGYVLMVIGALICAFAILMRLAWPALAGNFFESAVPDLFGMGQMEIQFEGNIPDDLPADVRQEIEQQLMGSGIFGDPVMDQMGGMIHNALNAQANLFLILLLPGLLLLAGGLIVVVKGKKLAAKETL